ncbi:MAG: hypothetical protein WD226_08270 [Planctomycetota bacterium]
MRLFTVPFVAVAIATASVVLTALAVVLTALAVVPSATAGMPATSTSTWKVTSGGTLGTTPFPSGGTVPSVSYQGKIDPPLAPRVGGTLDSITVVCAGEDQQLLPTDFAGAAQGASFTIQFKQSALEGKCSNTLTACYDMTYGKEYVTLLAPTAFNTAVIDPGNLTHLPPYAAEVAVQVVDVTGALDTSYNGEVVVEAKSEGGGVKLDGAWGQAVVTIEDGAGSLLVDASNVPSGKLVTFELDAARTDKYRTSIERL